MTRFYWERFDGGVPAGAELAALRRGVSGEPGCVPSMWPYLRPAHGSAPDPGLRELDELAAEHHALVLFALHQQSKSHLVHQRRVPMAHELRKLFTIGPFSEAAVDRRFFAAVGASELGEVVHHLRGLVRQLHSLPVETAFDYTRLAEDLRWWPEAAGRNRVVRAWGRAYHRAELHADDPADGANEDRNINGEDDR